jgi:hypothetical protein
MEEAVFFAVLAALVWGWPILGAIVGLCLPGRRIVGALVGFVIGCLMTGAAYHLVPRLVGL